MKRLKPLLQEGIGLIQYLPFQKKFKICPRVFGDGIQSLEPAALKL